MNIVPRKLKNAAHPARDIKLRRDIQIVPFSIGSVAGVFTPGFAEVTLGAGFSALAGAVAVVSSFLISSATLKTSSLKFVHRNS
jgi:hypothetical protein